MKLENWYLMMRLKRALYRFFALDCRCPYVIPFRVESSTAGDHWRYVWWCPQFKL